MPKFVMLVGLPGSGKSTIAPLVAVKEKALLLSSDKMRQELFGDETHQDDNGLLFDQLYARARQTLKEGRSVVIDSTNISQKRRMGVIKQFERYVREVYYLATPYEVCRQRNQARDRVVPEAALLKMYKSLQIPALYEGWDEIHLMHHETPSETPYAPFGDEQAGSHDRLFGELAEWSGYFRAIHDMAQDTPHHSFSVSRHSYHVLDHLRATYEGEDREQMLWAALLHDLGKSVCKAFKPGSRYAHFYGHENVSAQMTVELLRKAGYDDLYIYEVAQVVQLHMRLLHNQGNADANAKLKALIGKEMYQTLEMFRKADVSGK
ncbi:AAA family ATPase [Tumebacillus sp. DT12]|uniref:AAA family ATPase n=1 Tax=Tumebacillus lacus TaxID=2995335 RepID=A0ABT3X1Z2_9BACL|nr:AAA family ATPase [Tumebacillus lacus]MCX7570935.1 AAA family ATPase [Tumebacillus lacus]